MPSRRGPGSSAKTQSVDVMDGVGSAIRVDTRGREVMRVLRASTRRQRGMDFR